MQPNACAINKVKNDMSRKGEEEDGNEESYRYSSPLWKDQLPPEILDIVKPALTVGTLSGMSGLLVGAFAGIIRGSSPLIVAVAGGIQWFAVGTTFWASREAILQKWGKETVNPRDRTTASAISGGVGGTVSGLLRGPKSIIPSALMFALFGAAGQAIYNSSESRANAPEKGVKTSWLDSKWSPLKVLSDSEYEEMLQKKLMKVNAEIALVDDSIESVRVEERELERQGKAKDVISRIEKGTK